jgi:hypothetical protein
VSYRLIAAGAVASAVGCWLLIETAAAETGASSTRTPAATRATTGQKPSPARDGTPAGTAAAVNAKSNPPSNVSMWSQAEIDAAVARCHILLSHVDAVAIPADAIKEGNCGAPAPVQLVSIGSSPQVSLSPPPIVTCELAAALAQWLGAEVQPAARSLLGGPVIRLEVMSDYSCRNAYARINARLSEHGRANAVDISRFVTERGDTAEVRLDWGTTERDIRAQIAAKEAAQKAAAATAKAEARSAEATTLTSDGLRGSMAATDSVLNSIVTPSAGSGAGLTTTPTFSFGQPSRLGGPRAEPQPQASARQRFLRRIHQSACRHFGTVLGPEANEAHRHHFHLDMAERPIKNICE